MGLFKGLYRKAIVGVMQSKPYRWLLKSVIPYIRFTTYYAEFPGPKFYEGYEILKPGDIILTTDDKKLTTVLIGGDITHAALCVSKDKQWEVSEMTHSDYTKSTFFDVCKQSTRVLILRCRDWDEEYTKLVIARCRGFESAKYDIDFDLGVIALYCSELVYQSDFDRKLQVNLEDLAGLGRQYISPTGLLKAKNCDIVWDSNGS